MSIHTTFATIKNKTHNLHFVKVLLAVATIVFNINEDLDETYAFNLITRSEIHNAKAS